MTHSQNEYFGGPLIKLVQEKCDLLWPLLKDDPRFCFHGRAVGLADMQFGDLEPLVSLTKLTGAGACDYVPVEEVEKLQSSLEALGLKSDRMEVWRSDGSTIDAAREIIATSRWPVADDLVWVDAHTTGAEMQKLDEFTQEHGTSLPMGSFLRGVEKPAVCAYVCDEDGRVIVTSASVGQYHDSHQNSDMAYWGMLATREDNRGQGAALALGAHAIVAMYERHGLGRFFTAIKDGNTASENLCSKLGFSRKKAAVLIAIDTSVLPASDG